MAEERVAVVTGASRGIGRAIAVALAEAGHAVAIVYRNDVAQANEVFVEVEAAGSRALTCKGDVGNEADVDVIFDMIERELGTVSIVVNNAGVARDGLSMTMALDDWNEVLRVNATGAFLVGRRALKGMLRNEWGRIVNVSSASAYLGTKGQANYAASKGALVSLTRVVAREVAKRGITSNVVVLGPIETDMLAGTTDKRRDEMRMMVPMARFGRPSEVAAVVAFLCSDAASYLTGAVIPIDGGVSMGL